MLTLFKSSQHVVTLPSECAELFVFGLKWRPGHRDLRTSTKFTRLNHHFPASAEGVVPLVDERFIFPSILFLCFLGILVPGLENRVFISFIRILEIAAYCTVCGSLLMEYYWTFRRVCE